MIVDIDNTLPLKLSTTTYRNVKILNASRTEFRDLGETQGIDYIAEIFDATIIGTSCFKDYAFLNEVNIHSDLEVIDDFAFYGCYQLEKINIPRTIKLIGWRAFHDCDSLELNLDTSLFYTPVEISDSFLVKKLAIRGVEYKDLSHELLAQIRFTELYDIVCFVCKKYETNYSHTLDDALLEIAFSLFLSPEKQKKLREKYNKDFELYLPWKDKLTSILYKYLRSKKKISYLEFEKNSKTNIVKYIDNFYNVKLDKEIKETIKLKGNPLKDMSFDEVYQSLEKVEISVFNLSTSSSILEFGSNLDYYFGYAASIISDIISLQNNDDEKTLDLKRHFEDIYDMDTYDIAYNYVVTKEQSILKQIKKIEEANKILTCYMHKINECKKVLLEINSDNEMLKKVADDRIDSFNSTMLATTDQLNLINNWLTINSEMKNKLNELKNTTLPLLIMNINKQNSDDEIINIKEKIDILISKLFYEELDKETRKIKKKKI